MRNDYFFQPEQWKVYFLGVKEKQSRSRVAHFWEDWLIANE